MTNRLASHIVADNIRRLRRFHRLRLEDLEALLTADGWKLHASALAALHQ